MSDMIGGRKSLMKFADRAVEFAGARRPTCPCQLEERHLSELVQRVLLLQLYLFFYYYYVFMGNPGSNNCHPAACKCSSDNKQPRQKSSPGLPLERTRCFRLSHFRCHSVVATHRKHMASPTGCLLSFWWPAGKWWWEGYLLVRSLAIQPATFCFEGQELSIRTLIS